MSEKINWLSILQGWSMLLVVIGHVVLTDYTIDKDYPLSSYLYSIIYSFHMPLFIFISGWLLFYTCIRKNKSYKQTIISKAKRLLIPFYFFTIVTIIIKIALSSFVKRPVDIDELLNTFIFYSSNPLKALWYIITLFIMILGYPIYIWMVKSKLREGFMLLLALFLFIFFPNDIHLFQLHKFKSLFFFFIIGIVVCNHNIIEKLKSKSIGLISIGLFILCNIFCLNTDIVIVDFINSIIGILFSICVCYFIEKIRPNMFSSFRDYTFQIYLISMFPQMALRIIYMRNDLNSFYTILFFLSIILGLYIPVIFAKLLKKKPTILNKCIGL